MGAGGARKIGTLATCEEAVSSGLHYPAVILHKFLNVEVMSK